MFLEHGTGAESDLVGVQDEIRIPLSIQKKSAEHGNIEGKSGCRYGPMGNEVFLAKSSGSRRERQKERGRELCDKSRGE